MKIWLTIANGDQAGRRFEIGLGQVLHIGRDVPCEVRISGDSLMSNPHCAIAVTANGARIRDLGSKFGTLRNGRKIDDAELKHGDVVRAGQTEFEIAIEQTVAAEPPAVEPAVTPPDSYGLADTAVGAPERSGSLRPILYQHLSNQRGLYSLLDAAREMSVPYRLQEARVAHESLYDGAEGAKLSSLGPWLAEVKPGSSFLRELVDQGWGKSWGVYLASARPLKEVRHHLRRFLMVGLPGKVAYFRFYDPRVLRVYLPTCTSDESMEFFGPIASYQMENEDGKELLTFTAGRREPVRVRLDA